MAEQPDTEQSDGLVTRRARKRIESFSLDKDTIAQRIKTFYDNDNQDRGEEIEARLQRYAKYRMWTSGKDWPWPDSTDAALPDMMTTSMRMQDTLVNAVMSQRPPIMAKAMHKTLKEKEETINNLIDFQIFEEQPGEDLIGQIADDFVNEGVFTAYIPWVKEERGVRDITVYDPIPRDTVPGDYFAGILQGIFPRGFIEASEDGWDWKIEDDKGKRSKASFFTRDDDKIELEIEREVVIFDGPRVMRKDVQQVLHPVRCENLQIPGPSNPNGAPHVILVDFPSVDEIKRLHKSGYYDLLSDEDAEKLGIKSQDKSNQEREEQKDILQGSQEHHEKPRGAESHKTLTRLMCFDCFDVDGDGLDEDVIWWMILEDNIMLRARYLTQMFPSNPPRRPFAEGSLFPVPGRRLGIGILEMMEGLHDLMKQFFDQMGDGGTLANAPFGYYRATSSMRPEVIRMWPGEMYPLSDPKNDVHFPQLGNQNQAFYFNVISLLTQVEERLTTIGDLQVGRVPQGKASALRTVAGMQTVLAQGDARPERVLRRFFLGLSQIWQAVHALNEVFLPSKKKFMLAGAVDPRNDPYREITSPDQIRGKFRFTFSANVLNTSKEALRAALGDLLGIYVSELSIQLGVLKPDGFYRLMRDYGRAWGQDPDKYITPPSIGAMEPGILAEDAIQIIMQGEMPKGAPLEGAEPHMKKLIDFMESDEFGFLDPQVVPLYGAYVQQVAAIVQQERQQQALLAAAQNFGRQAQQPGQPGPQGQPQPGAQTLPPVNENELLDETLPGAGGGAAVGAA